MSIDRLVSSHGPEVAKPFPISPLLTIAIPTYNRSRCLVRLLSSLTGQLTDTPEVEVLVVDNASPDDTPLRLEEYRNYGLRLRCLRNETNIGGDRNFIRCFEEARGKYVWIIGDDDIVLANTLAFILNLLREGEYDLVHLRGKDFAEGSIPPAAPSRPPSIEIIDDARTFTRRTHVQLTFISGNIINKDRVLALAPRPFSDLAGTNLVQLGWTFTALRHLRKGVVIREALLGVGSEERGGYAVFRVFGTNLKQVTEEWLVEQELVAIVLNGTIQTALPSWVFQTRNGVGFFSEERPEQLLRSLFQQNFRYRFFVSPLLWLPRRLGRAWLLLIRVVNWLDRAWGNPMLG